ncbi:DsrE/DsrF-like family [Acididesulfobacillus acetoxydans]|uniref:DsrE/DsrF-like family n=1 Tax=Acididesulfobacillus acetoxydans TaxID=1561005 RepID=A0A8S0WZK7_9FIRM|nr:DsrE family protein [Acididesulfobacillus acetoxydans]CAA7602011.1 DsrE/DsrF-like family [Acididesulfobacillus acetoxydans]CEJ08146.1 DsrEFH-like [Acididesulfobacillus acetoxydans]
MSFIYLISSDTIGHHEPALGRKLMAAFVRNLEKAEQKPNHILFVEKGVKLLLPEFSELNALRALENDFGVKLLACVTCLDYYGIREKIEIGRESNMAEIISVMHSAQKVINL